MHKVKVFLFTFIVVVALICVLVGFSAIGLWIMATHGVSIGLLYAVGMVALIISTGITIVS
jgi:uncharacterized protein YqfA (UPF0365 family)